MKTGNLYKTKNIDGEVTGTILFLDDVSDDALNEIKNGSLLAELYQVHVLMTELNPNRSMIHKAVVCVLMEVCPDLRKDILESFFGHEKK